MPDVHADRRGRAETVLRRPVVTMLRLLPGVSVPLTLSLVPVLLIGGVLPVLQAVAISVAIGAIPDATRLGFGSASGQRLLLGVAVAAIAIVAAQTVIAIRSVISDALGRRLNAKLRERVMTAVAGPGTIGQLDNDEFDTKVAQARGIRLGGVLPGQAVNSFASVTSAWLTALGAALVLSTFRWWLAIALIAAWALTRHRLVSEADKFLTLIADQSPAMRRAEYFRQLALTAGAAKEIRVFSLGGWVVEQFRLGWLEGYGSVGDDREGGRARFWLNIAALMAVQLAAFMLLAQAGASGELGIARLALYLQAILTMNVLAQSLQDDVIIRYGLAALPGVTAVQEMAGEPWLDLSGSKSPKGRPATSISLQDVSFRYRDNQADVLHGLNLEIAAGESLAIVGANGSGKTTLAKLLCRLYDPTGGRIFVDDIELREFDARGWQRQVAAVFQDFVRYPLTATDNVAFGSLAHAGDHEALEDCARVAGVLPVINGLPNAWETVLSAAFGGVDLSGGEWQRIALARALFAMHGGARLLVMDEPTASMDVRSEAAFYDHFLEMTRGLTTILISHRFATVRRADRICVLEAGRVAELGTHLDLLAADGRYARMFKAQAAGFTAVAAGGAAVEAARSEPEARLNHDLVHGAPGRPGLP